jgi:hypothetical protein
LKPPEPLFVVTNFTAFGRRREVTGFPCRSITRTVMFWDEATVAWTGYELPAKKGVPASIFWTMVTGAGTKAFPSTLALTVMVAVPLRVVGRKLVRAVPEPSAFRRVSAMPQGGGSTDMAMSAPAMGLFPPSVMVTVRVEVSVPSAITQSLERVAAIFTGFRAIAGEMTTMRNNKANMEGALIASPHQQERYVHVIVYKIILLLLI